MEFFVPTVSGDGHMPPDEAEEAWNVCRKGAQQDMGRDDTLARRVFRLRYGHNGRVMDAVVGQREQYYDRELVMAIIAFPNCYVISGKERGYSTVGSPMIVGLHDVRHVEDFGPAAPDDDASESMTSP